MSNVKALSPRYLSLLQLMHLKIWFIVMLSNLLLPSAHGQYLDPNSKTQVNKVDPLFNESVDNYQNFEKEIESLKESAALGAGNRAGFNDLVGSNKAESEAESLSNITASDLEVKGREEYAKDPTINEYFVDYSKPGMKMHRVDAETIAGSSSKMMSSIFDMLKEVGVDCKSVKGNKEVEPEHFIETETKLDRDKGDTIYDQFFCEYLRDKYSCTDSLTMRCLRFSEKQADVTINSSSMNYRDASGNIKRFNFEGSYGSGGGASRYGGGKIHGFINKSSGSTRDASEANWQINLNLKSDLTTVNRVQIHDLSYGTFIMIKINGNPIFVGPTGGNDLQLSGHITVESKGKRKYAGVAGKKTTHTERYPRVITGQGEYGLGLSRISSRSSIGEINLLPHMKLGENNIEIKAIALGGASVTFSLDISERACLDWQEIWSERCTLD